MKVPICAALVAVAVNAAETCRALAMSGGGANGAWEAGVVWGLVNYGKEADFEWDVMTGVSAGSLNSMGLAGWPKNQGKQAAQFLSDVWTNLTDASIYQMWPEGEISGFVNHGSIYDNSPLHKTLQDLLAQFLPTGYQKRVVMAATDANLGAYHLFTNDNTKFQDLWQAAVASSSIPGIFPPYHWQGTVFFDGYTIWNVNLQSAIDECMKIVDDPSKIIVDVAICGVVETEEKSDTGLSINNYLRGQDIKTEYNSGNSIDEIRRAYPTVNYRHLVFQEQPAGGLKELDFANKSTWKMQETGRTDAQNAINLGEGTGFDLFSKFRSTKHGKTWTQFVQENI